MALALTRVVFSLFAAWGLVTGYPAKEGDCEVVADLNAIQLTSRTNVARALVQDGAQSSLAAGPLATHWRLTSLGNTNGNYWCMGNIEFHDSNGVISVSGATFDADSTGGSNTQTGGYSAERAFNLGTTGDDYCSNWNINTGKLWIVFPSAVQPTFIRMQPDVINDCPTEFKWEASNDGVSWSSVGVEEAGYAWTSGNHDFPLSASTPTAFGDPHIKNMRGQAFELRSPGIHLLLNVPQGAAAADALARVDASVERVGSRCSSLFIRRLDITGQWLGSVPSLTFGSGSALPGEAHGAVLKVGNSSALAVEDFLDRVPSKMVKLTLPSKEVAVPSVANKHSTLMMASLKLGPGVGLAVSWTNERLPSASVTAAHSLWLSVTGLSAVGAKIGGLLGVDDHQRASEPDASCMHERAGSLLGVADQAIVAAASLQ